MASLLGSTQNTRCILPNDFRYIRSDVPCQITAKETEWLLQQDVRTVIDLRTWEEQQRKPCTLQHHPAFTYHSLPVSGGSTVPATPEDVAASYIAMADGQMRRIIQTIQQAESNVLYFCNAGKDRTGVVSAILLALQGIPDADIVLDYMKSKPNLMPMLLSYAAQNPSVDIRVITPSETYIQGFLDWLKQSNFLEGASSNEAL